jgi:hypothetical protein
MFRVVSAALAGNTELKVSAPAAKVATAATTLRLLVSALMFSPCLGLGIQTASSIYLPFSLVSSKRPANPKVTIDIALTEEQTGKVRIS